MKKAFKLKTRGLYETDGVGGGEPYKVSRSGIELFVECPKCFYLDKRLGIARPQGPAFTINTAVDTLLKKEFDAHRAKGVAHPFMKAYGIDAVPFAHEMLDEWRENFKGIQYLHEPTGLKVAGAVDDIWVNKKGELIIADYKATAKKEEVTLDADWQMSYKRQMEVYQWLLRRLGFKVSSTGYFVYCNGRTDRAAFDGKVEFDVKIIPYTGDDSWVEPILPEIKKCLEGKKVPKAPKDCEYCGYVAARAEL